MEIFRIINNLANKNILMDETMIFFSTCVPYIFMAILVLVFASGIVNKNGNYRKAAVNTFIITAINLLLNFLIGSIYYVDRPFVHNKVNLLFPHVEDASFPSDHATGTMSIALGLQKYNKLVSKLLIGLSIIVGFSRVYVGQHYPMDVIGSYIIAFITNHFYNMKIRNSINNLYDKTENKLLLKKGKKGTVT